MRFFCLLLFIAPLNAHAFMIVSQLGGTGLFADGQTGQPEDEASPRLASSDLQPQADEALDPEDTAEDTIEGADKE